MMQVHPRIHQRHAREPVRCRATRRLLRWLAFSTVVGFATSCWLPDPLLAVDDSTSESNRKTKNLVKAAQEANKLMGKLPPTGNDVPHRKVVASKVMEGPVKLRLFITEIDKAEWYMTDREEGECTSSFNVWGYVKCAVGPTSTFISDAEQKQLRGLAAGLKRLKKKHTNSKGKKLTVAEARVAIKEHEAKLKQVRKSTNKAAATRRKKAQQLRVLLVVHDVSRENKQWLLKRRSKRSISVIGEVNHFFVDKNYENLNEKFRVSFVKLTANSVQWP